MARTYQDKFMDAVEKAATSTKQFEMVSSAEYANTGRWSVTRRTGFEAAVVVIRYDFQGPSATLHMQFRDEKFGREVRIDFLKSEVVWWRKTDHSRASDNFPSTISEVVGWIADAVKAGGR